MPCHDFCKHKSRSSLRKHFTPGQPGHDREKQNQVMIFLALDQGATQNLTTFKINERW
jgi:hypothetical protein